MDNLKIYIESGQVHIVPIASDVDGLNTSLPSLKPRIRRFPANGELTASIVDTNKIKVVDSTGKIIFTKVPFANLKEKDGTTDIGASASAVRDNLNGTHYFGASTLETKLSTETAKITALENATKTATNDRGIYINDLKGTSQGHLQITDTIANLQAGPTTRVALTDIATGQGSIEFNVRAGANGQQTSVTALSIAGHSQFNNATVTFSQPVTFSSSVSGTNHLGNANLALTEDRSLTLDGSALTIQSSSTTNHESLIVADDGQVTIGPGSSQGASILSIREASGNGTNSVSLTVADSLASDLSFTLPSTDGSAGQFLTTDGSGGLSFATPTDTNTNIGNSNFSLSSGTRTIGLNNTNTSFRIMTGQGTPFQITNTSTNGGRISINGDLRIDSGSLSGGLIKLEENPQGGGNFVALQAPNSIAADLTLTLPATDGSSGQFLKTDGSGNLSFASAGTGGGMTETPFVSMSGRAAFGTADTEERVLIGTSYGWSFYNQTTEMGDWSSSDTIDSTTYSLAAYLRGQGALQMPSDEKKIRMKVTYRVQNGNSTDFGFSIWSGAIAHNSTASANVTLRGASATQTVGTSSITAYKKEFTTTSTITDDAVFLTCEQRGNGSLTTTAYVYYNIHLFLVD